MSRLNCIFSNIKKTFSKGEGKVKLTSPNKLSNSEKFERKNVILEKVLSSLKSLRDNVKLAEKVSHSSPRYAYFKTEYPRGSFCETFDGELLIPEETIYHVKEKVR